MSTDNQDSGSASTRQPTGGGFSPQGAFSGFSVRDTTESLTFYRDLLGLAAVINSMGFLELTLASGARVLAYQKPGHESASFTILNFEVADVEAAVDDLAARGVSMTIYPGMPLDGKGIMRGNGPDIAWFTDPSGNVLSVLKSA